MKSTRFPLTAVVALFFTVGLAFVMVPVDRNACAPEDLGCEPDWTPRVMTWLDPKPIEPP